MFMPSFLLWYVCNVSFCSQVDWKNFVEKKELVFSQAEIFEWSVGKGSPVGGFFISVLLFWWGIHGGGGAQGCVWRSCCQPGMQSRAGSAGGSGAAAPVGCAGWMELVMCTHSSVLEAQDCDLNWIAFPWRKAKHEPSQMRFGTT